MATANGSLSNGHSSPANGSTPDLCLFVPSPLHIDAYTRAKELGVDLILPDDPRRERWYEHADAIVWRQHHIGGDYHLARKLKIIARNGTGYDFVDVETCKKLGVAVTNLPGFNAECVAELTYCLAISVARRVTEFDRRLRAGETIPSALNMGLSLYRKTIGLVGMGDIAREVARKFHYGSSCRIIVYSPTSPTTRWTKASTEPNNIIIPHTRAASLDELLEASDVVSLHCPEIPETRNMMGASQFAKMNSKAIFLNLGRGGLVDEEALYNACKSRVIFGAGLDVFQKEPVNSVNYGDTLFSLPNIIAQPHSGAGTIDIVRDSTVTALETAVSYCRRGDIGVSTLVRELAWEDLSRRPSS